MRLPSALDGVPFSHDIKHPDDLVWMPTGGLFRQQAVKDVRALLARVHVRSDIERAEG